MQRNGKFLVKDLMTPPYPPQMKKENSEKKKKIKECSRDP